MKGRRPVHEHRKQGFYTQSLIDWQEVISRSEAQIKFYQLNMGRMVETRIGRNRIIVIKKHNCISEWLFKERKIQLLSVIYFCPVTVSKAQTWRRDPTNKQALIIHRKVIQTGQVVTQRIDIQDQTTMNRKVVTWIQYIDQTRIIKTQVN